MLARLGSLPLFWQVFGTNALALVLEFLGLVFLPVTVSVPPHATELAVLVAGLLEVLAINLLLLRRAPERRRERTPEPRPRRAAPPARPGP